MKKNSLMLLSAAFFAACSGTKQQTAEKVSVENTEYALYKGLRKSKMERQRSNKHGN